MSNPYTPGSPVAPVAGMVPPELAKKAANMQLMGILSIVFAFCCGCVGLILSIIVLVQAGSVQTTLAQYGSPPDLMNKVSTGKTCAIIALVIMGIGIVIGVIANVAQLAVQRGG
jgi:hypothetical protein